LEEYPVLYRQENLAIADFGKRRVVYLRIARLFYVVSSSLKMYAAYMTCRICAHLL